MFSRAVNCALAEDLWTLLGAGQTDTPFGIGSVAEFAGLGVRRGDRSVRAGYLGIGRLWSTAARRPLAAYVRTPPGDGACKARLARDRRCEAGRARPPNGGRRAAALRRTDRSRRACERWSDGGRGSPRRVTMCWSVFLPCSVRRLGARVRGTARLAMPLRSLLPTTTEISRTCSARRPRASGRALHELG